MEWLKGLSGRRIGFALVLLPICGFMGWSFAKAALGDSATDFQRFGSVIVAFTVFAFALTNKELTTLRKSVDSDKLERLQAAAESIRDLEQSVSELSEAELATEEKAKINEVLSVKEEVENGLELLPQVARFLRNLSIAEIALLIVGTLQWGYGDLFHCWAHGNGWQVCY
ncbi:hypothetical protein SAMN05444287_0918 [Octadecabacter temperatus]|uniref:Uncharacterized protein n=1 Tax=Octadecabacter temperatus TaxID=1458307 RepID=A0A0K0Y4D6_9RHOB|nr:hypothetical protein [Octadecabacter temperatus]AKS45819.1 hypothetical protein OSB_12640 [Octadecabacter temperatus]SIO01241.1 hypothetical protein SAMN05444287_0918 [Octadecabacter temperatus]